MLLIKKTVAVALSAIFMLGCDFKLDGNNPNSNDVIKIGTFNVSLDRQWFGQLVDEMQINYAQQQILVGTYFNNKSSMNEDEKSRAEKVIQIRNISAIIQKVRPEILFLSKFNNNGNDHDERAIRGFQENYLGIGQSTDGFEGGEKEAPIFYPYAQSFATNSGENSGLDLDNNGINGQMPGDAWGYGNYHGQQAFALLSMHEIDRRNTRSFQYFKWKDMPTANNPLSASCKQQTDLLEISTKCTRNWYDKHEWNRMRLSSNNHIDVPIKIRTQSGNKTLHLLLSNPVSPSEGGKITENNLKRNRDEIQFWSDYIDNKDYIYDDRGRIGGLKEDANFLIVGQLNADPLNGNSDKFVINQLLSHPKINVNATLGNATPRSNGAAEEYPQRFYPDQLTTVNGLRVDYIMPSNTLKIDSSGVYWPAIGEKGYLLVNDERVGKLGIGKDVSSDHRLVWMGLKL